MSWDGRELTVLAATALAAAVGWSMCVAIQAGFVLVNVHLGRSVGLELDLGLLDGRPDAGEQVVQRVAIGRCAVDNPAPLCEPSACGCVDRPPMARSVQAPASARSADRPW